MTSSNFQGKTVFVTGAGGFSGSSVISALLKNGHKVIALLYKDGSIQLDCIEEKIKKQKKSILEKIPPGEEPVFYAASLADLAIIDSIIRKHSVDIVIHLAGLSNVVEAEENEQRAITVNVDLTVQLGMLVASYSKESKRTVKLIYISSTRVLESTNDVKLKSYTTLKAVYDRTKYLAESKLRRVDGLSAAIVYSPGLFGAGRSNTLMSTWVRNAVTRKNLVIMGDGDTVVPLCSLTCFSNELLKIAEQEWHSMINTVLIEPEYSYSLNKMAKMICRALDRVVTENITHSSSINTHEKLIVYGNRRKI